MYNRPFTKNIPFTTSRTVFWACPKMFAAEHRYMPASPLLIFLNCSRPSETVDCSSSEPFNSLFHFIFGLGLPLTEHWKTVDSVSFTVRIWGETSIVGPEIDSPGSPFIPGIPVAPMSPFSPLGPVFPFNPVMPVIPRFPLFPGSPARPLSPFFPGLPLLPFGPGGPGGPGGPQGLV